MPRPPVPSACSPLGIHPVARGEEKRRHALSWIGVFGYTTTPIIQRLLNVQSNSLPASMHRAGLIAPVDLPGVRQRLWMLTAHGKAIAELHLCRAISVPRGVRISTAMVVHQLLLQREFLAYLQEQAGQASGPIDLDYALRHTRESRDLQSIDALVRPDVLTSARTADGRRIAFALELERSPKGHTELEHKFQLLLHHHSRRYDALHVRWCILGGDRVVSRYRSVWDSAVSDALLHDERSERELRTMCSFHPVAETLWVR